MMQSTPMVGITVLPEYLQCESVDRVLENLVSRAGVTAVATSPYVMQPCDEGEGSREPPIDAGAGAVRLLDRPLWGRRELWVRTAPSFEPRTQFYSGLRYQPAAPSELTQQQGSLVCDFLDAARRHGLQVYFQVQAAIPPGYRVQFGGPQDDDKPRMPDGSIPSSRVANNGTLASPHIADYECALIRDLCHAYPQLDGIRFDWPEFPPYSLDDMFVDFGPHAQHSAHHLGFDFAAMHRDATQLYAQLHGGLGDSDLRRLGGQSLEQLLQTELARWRPGVAQLLQFKAALVAEFLAVLRGALDDASEKRMQLVAFAFPPPWSLLSGFDFHRAGPLCDSIGMKLYGMHWAMMLRSYGRQLQRSNSGISESLLTRTLVRLLDIADDDGLPTLDDYAYPDPQKPHPVGSTAQARKIARAQEAAGDTSVQVLVHGYGPPDDFRRRLELAWRAGNRRVWINRYGYLSDEKLGIVADVTRNRSAL